MVKDFCNIMCIVNSGYSEEVMEAARKCGAKGGTIINARGTAKANTLEKFNIQIHPEKEIVMILAPIKIKDDILKSVYEKCGLQTEGNGIAFVLPVDDMIGVKR
jgi:nitrogen regulatory protein PII